MSQRWPTRRPGIAAGAGAGNLLGALGFWRFSCALGITVLSYIVRSRARDRCADRDRRDAAAVAFMVVRQSLKWVSSA
jgi:hypothetical protein